MVDYVKSSFVTSRFFSCLLNFVYYRIRANTLSEKVEHGHVQNEIAEKPVDVCTSDVQMRPVV